MTTRILLVEDSLEFQHIVKRALSPAGFELHCVASAAEAMDLCGRLAFDLIILDVSLPDEDGFRLCARLQNLEATRHVPVFFLTGRTDVYDKVLAFSLGADDYIVKPFDPVEFRARVEAKLAKRARRSEWGDPVVQRGRLKLDKTAQKAFCLDEKGDESVDVRLTPAEFRLLLHLVRNEGRCFTRQELLKAVWGEGSDVIEQNVYTHISSLRRKLDRCGKYIESIPSQGYRFNSNPAS